MKHKLLNLFLVSILGSFSFAQSFTVSPSDNVYTPVVIGNYVTAEILMENTGSNSLFLGWTLLNKITPTGWDYSYCDYNTCYTGVTTSGTMAEVLAGENGFIKVNVSTTTESWSYFQFRVFNVNDTEDADTIEFWFNGTAGVTQASVEKLAVYPNPLTGNSSLTIDNIPANSTIKIVNSLGQIVYSDITISSDKIVLNPDWNKGVYFIKIGSGSLTETRKLIVK